MLPIGQRQLVNTSGDANGTRGRQRIIFAVVVALVVWALGPRPALSVTVLEDFEAYDLQTDTMPFLQVHDASGNVVAIAEDSLAASTGIGLEGSNRFWTLGSSAGTTGTEGFVMIGDIPGFGSNGGGPLGSFFSTPQNLTGGTVMADVREVTGSASTQFRFLLDDMNFNEVTTGTFPLTTGFSTFSATAGDFTNSLGPGTFDVTKVINLGFEYFTTPGTPAFTFNVDNVQLTTPEPVPEPATLFLLGSGLVGLGGTAWRRRRSGPQGELTPARVAEDKEVQ